MKILKVFKFYKNYQRQLIHFFLFQYQFVYINKVTNTMYAKLQQLNQRFKHQVSKTPKQGTSGSEVSEPQSWKRSNFNFLTQAMQSFTPSRSVAGKSIGKQNKQPERLTNLDIHTINIGKSIIDYKMDQNRHQNKIYSQEHRKASPLCQTNFFVEQNNTYSLLLQTSRNLRQQNYKLKSQLTQLQQRVKLMEQQAQISKVIKDNHGNINNFKEQQGSNFYINRMKNLQQEYSVYKKNLHDNYMKELREIKEIQQSFIRTVCLSKDKFSGKKNKQFQSIIQLLKNKGTKALIEDKNIIEQFISSIPEPQNSMLLTKNTVKPTEKYCTDNIKKIIETTQNQHLKIKIQQLSHILTSIIEITKRELISIKQQATGHSEQIIQQLKQCIVNNFNKNSNFVQLQCPQAKLKYISISSSSQVESIKNPSTKTTKKPSLNTSTSKLPPKQKKRLSLGNSFDVNQLSRPPLPVSDLTVSTKNSKVRDNNTKNYFDYSIQNISQTPKNYSHKKIKNNAQHISLDISANKRPNQSHSQSKNKSTKKYNN